MTWSYDPTDLATDPKDEVRFFVQDTISTRPLLQDEEIQYLIDTYGALYSSNIAIAAICADILVSRFATEVSISADGVSISLEGLMKNYQELANSLRDTYSRIAGAGFEPVVGGIDKFDLPDFSVKAPNFGIGMDDNFEAGPQRFGDRGDIPWSWYGDPSVDW